MVLSGSGVLTVQINISEDKNSLAKAASGHAARTLRKVLQEQSTVRLIAAAGASQFEFLDLLTAAPSIDWSRVEMFHLDEYVGLPITHPASFRKYLLERLIHKTKIKVYHLLNGEGDPNESALQVGKEISAAPIDLAFVGIGENSHLAFNDPPADFQTESPYILVELDEACRRQQLNEGWFPTLADVPKRAISMTVKQVLKSKEIIAIVPDLRKAHAVKACLQAEISPLHPASILRRHPDTTLYLDKNSASLLGTQTVAGL
jgi:glucosamine-6-phosphate deaminase